MCARRHVKLHQFCAASCRSAARLRLLLPCDGCASAIAAARIASGFPHRFPLALPSTHARRTTSFTSLFFASTCSSGLPKETQRHFFFVNKVFLGSGHSIHCSTRSPSTLPCASRSVPRTSITLTQYLLRTQLLTAATLTRASGSQLLLASRGLFPATLLAQDFFAQEASFVSARVTRRRQSGRRAQSNCTAGRRRGRQEAKATCCCTESSLRRRRPVALEQQRQ